MPSSWTKIVVGAALVVALATPQAAGAAAAPPRDITEFACARNLENPFNDVTGTTHEVAIECLFALGVVSGTSATTFSPSDRVTRAQLASLIARSLAFAGVPLDTADAGFIDLGGSVHTDAINALANLGVLTGKRPNRFAPDDRATRAQTATIVARTVTDELPAAPPDAFVDDEGATAHEPSINQLAAVGVITGVDAEHYDPERPIGRGPVATIVARILDFTVERGLVAPPSASADVVAVLTATDVVPGPGEPGALGSVSLLRGGLPGLVCVQWDIDGPFTSAPTSAHVHAGAAGATGPVLLTLPTPAVAPGQRLFSRQCVSDRNERDIETLFANPAGHYVDIETSGQAGGAVRGQLTTATTPLGTVLAAGEQVGGGESGAGGDATVDLLGNGRSLCVSVAYDGDGTPTSAAIHRATAGASGPVVAALPPFDADGPIADGCVNVDPALVTDLNANPDAYYVQVNTDARPGGAVRGQLGRSRFLLAGLEGGSVRPGPGDPDGRGRASLDVVGDGRICLGLSANQVDRVVAAHIHKSEDPNGVGPEVATLPAPIFGFASGCVDADPAVVADMIVHPGSYYVDLHTQAFPNGAIRGPLGAFVDGALRAP